MKTSLEIEFKTFITEEKYNELLKSLGQEDNILIQTNHYFDDELESIQNQKKVLRIRQKGNQYKLTKKSKSDEGNVENHIYLTESQALDMLKNGFDASIINEPITVHKIGELTTYRTKFPYKSGNVFLDKSLYNNKVDYELEYEAQDKEIGKKEFDEILKEYGIDFKQSYSKFKRAMGK
ncbi:MAG: CYTH domain-containing protein [Acholeplasmatales bacterium]|nr:CYTH domain-containing protein [Acholeplasmatales bacterium]